MLRLISFVFNFCAFLIFKADVRDIQVILPSVSMEAATIAFFVFSDAFIPRARDIYDKGPVWFCRVFWFTFLNALMFTVNGVEFGAYRNMAFAAALLIVAGVVIVGINAKHRLGVVLTGVSLISLAGLNLDGQHPLSTISTPRKSKLIFSSERF